MPTIAITDPTSSSASEIASASAQVASASMSSATISETPTATPSNAQTSDPDAGMIVGSVAGAIVALGIVGISILWILRRIARQATNVAVVSNESFENRPVVRHAELPQYAYSTQGRSELFGGDRRGLNL